MKCVSGNQGLGICGVSKSTKSNASTARLGGGGDSNRMWCCFFCMAFSPQSKQFLPLRLPLRFATLASLDLSSSNRGWCLTSALLRRGASDQVHD